jgi:uncharacterized membrane protein
LAHLFAHPSRAVLQPEQNQVALFKQKIINMKNQIWQNLLLLLGVCLAMLGGRMWHTHEWTFLFLVWNLFLAWVPLGAAQLSVYFAQKTGWANGLASLSAMGAWLLFLPNAPYLITDLIHLRARHSAPLWYDSLMLFAFAVAGLVGGLYSAHLVHRALHRRVGAVGGWLLMSFCLGLTGFGVYLGRFQRWNSWDLWHRPRALAHDCLAQVDNPLALQVTLAFTTVLLIFYIMFARAVASAEEQAR